MLELMKATKKDKDVIASLVDEASEGLCDYLFEQNNSLITARQLLAFEIAKQNSPMSYSNCLVAKKNNEFAGVICCYDMNDFNAQLDRVDDPEKRQSISRYYQIQIPDNTLYIETIGVVKKFRRQGIARMLLNSLTHYLEESDYKEIALYVWNNNCKAINLYKSLGFKVIKQVEPYDSYFPIQQKRFLMTVSVGYFLWYLNSFSRGRTSPFEINHL